MYPTYNSSMLILLANNDSGRDYLFFSSYKSFAIWTYQNKSMGFLSGTGTYSSEKRTWTHAKSNGHLISFNNRFSFIMTKVTFNFLIVKFFMKQHLVSINTFFGINSFGGFRFFWLKTTVALRDKIEKSPLLKESYAFLTFFACGPRSDSSISNSTLSPS